MTAELPPGVGTVGEELTRLLAALSARQADPAPDDGDELPMDDEPPTNDGTPEGGTAATSGGHRHSASAPQRCGCDCHESLPMGAAQACSLCPVCQGIATLRTLNPALLDRLADLAAQAAEVFRELAATAATGGRPPTPPRQRTADDQTRDAARARRRREDIEVVDDPDTEAQG